MSPSPYEDLRVAVLGCGRMGKIRLAAIQRLGARVVGVHDPLDGAAAEAAPGVPHFETLDNLPLDELDAVFLCTPPDRRSQVERACIESGTAFFVEKPVGPDAAAALVTRQHLRKSPVLTAAGYMNRYRRSVRELRDALRDERVLGLSGKWVGGAYQRDWWLDASRSGGPVNEQATHLVDLVRFLAGEIASVVALGDGPAGVHCSVALTLESGARATLLYSCEAAEKSISMEAVTPTGTRRLDNWTFSAAGVQDDEDPNEVFAVETEAFLKAVATKDAGSILCDYEDALRTQLAVDAIHHSMASGSVVRLD